jgi:hypothetical protein
LLQADQIMVKPMDVTALVAAIKQRLVSSTPAVRTVETVGSNYGTYTLSSVSERIERLSAASST